MQTRRSFNIEEGATNGSTERRGHTGGGPTSHEFALVVVIAKIAKAIQVPLQGSRLALTDSPADDGAYPREMYHIVSKNTKYSSNWPGVFVHTRMNHGALFANRHATYDAQDDATHFT